MEGHGAGWTRATPVTALTLPTSLTPVSRHSHTAVWGLGLQHADFGGGGGCSSAQNTAKFDGPFPERVQFSVELPGCGPQATGCVDPPHCRSHPLAWKVFWFGQSVPRPPSCGRRWACFRSERIGGPSATFPNLRGQLPEVETFQFPLCVRRWLGTRTGLPFFILNTWPTVTCQALYATFYPHSGPEEGYCCDPPFFGCGTWKPVGLTT